MTSENCQIRHPLIEEQEQWHDLWQGYLRFYESTLDQAITDLLWQRIHDDAHEIQCRVAVRDGRLVGLVHFFPHAHTWYAAPVCYLNDLFVDPAIRGGGIGAALIQAVVDTAKTEDWAEVYWHTQNFNTVARGLYDKITGGTDGFVNYSISIVS